MLSRYKVYVFVSFCFSAINGCEIKSDETICASLESYKTNQKPEWKKLTINNWEHTVGDDAFASTTNLIKLHIHGAKSIEKNAFRGLSKLEKIILDNMVMIEDLPDSLFEGLPLTELTVSNSNLKHLKPGMFSALPQLKNIALHNNKITTIPSNVFSNTSITFVELANNSIATIADCAFCDMPKLRFLRLHENRLTSFEPQRILGQSSIQGLGLDENRLTAIPRFDTTPDLIGLTVSNNSITTIEEHFLEKCKNLQLIDVSHNQIKEIPANMLPEVGAKDGIFLILHNNKIECVSEEVRKRVKNLRRITLEENPWKCQCLDDVIAWGRDLKAAVSCETFQEYCKVSCFDADNVMKNITYGNSKP